MSSIALLLPKAPVPYNDLPKSPIPDLLKKPILFQYSPTTTTSDQGSPTTTQGLTKSTASSHGVSILSPPANDSLRQEMSGKFKSLSRPVATMESPKGSMKIERPNPAIVEIKLKCCRKEFTTYKNMMEHLEVSHSAKSELNFFTCWVCRATFQSNPFSQCICGPHTMKRCSNATSASKLLQNSTTFANISLLFTTGKIAALITL